MTENNSDIGAGILRASRSELYMNMPYLDRALMLLQPESGENVTVCAACDGETLYYNTAFLCDRYIRGSANVNRLYMHIVLHCLLRHMSKSRGRDARLWGLACDAAVESIIDSLEYECLKGNANPKRQAFYALCSSEMKVLTAEAIYLLLLRSRMSDYELASLEREFMLDDHGLWNPDSNDNGRSEQQDERWKDIASTTGTAIMSSLSDEANGGEALTEQLRIAACDGADYRAFLRRFAAVREIMKTDDDAFDLNYYTFGLARYGNLPLIEPPETKEDKRIEDMVIAIDTSMSTSGELVKGFLKCTYSALRSTETFTRRLNIHIMQCDDELRSDVKISSMKELDEYMNAVELRGGSATDFRPVFERVDELTAAGELKNLRGLIYFTDGMGIYPTKRPAYETAFVMLQPPPIEYKIPLWATRILIDGLELTEPDPGAYEAALEGEETEMPEL